MDNKKPIILPDNGVVNYQFEAMIKAFISKVKKDGTMEEIRARRYYIKPSAKKRAIKKGAKRSG